MSATTNGRFLTHTANGIIHIYDYFNGVVNSTTIANNLNLGADAVTTQFFYNIRLGDLVGGIFDLNKDLLLNETIFINLYLNNNFIYNVITASSLFNSFGNINTSSFFLKVAYQNNPAINAAIRNNIMNEGLTIPFEYISNLSFNDPIGGGAHSPAFSLRVYSLIGNKLRSIYLIPSALNATAADTASPIGIAKLSAANTVEFSIDSNLITKYDNNKFENLIYCRLSNKYWSSALQTSNFFLPIHFYNLNNLDNLNEGLNISSDSVIGFNCEASNNPNSAVSYDVFLIGIKNLIVWRSGVAVV